METEEIAPTTIGELNHSDSGSQVKDVDNLDVSSDACEETKVSHTADNVNGLVNSDNVNGHVNSDSASQEDAPQEDLKTNETSEGLSDHLNVPKNVVEGSPKAVKKRRRLSKAKSVSQVDNCDGTSRFGRTLKPKHDDDHFVPTEAILGKSPKKSRKSGNTFSTPLSGVKAKAMKIPSNLNGSLNDTFGTENDLGDIGDLSDDLKAVTGIGDLSDDLKAVREGEVEKESPEETVTEYEPGDLVWARLGHHPFWPAIVMCDPVDNVYFKTRAGPGRSRLMYHVMFYADNGKRGWVASSKVIRFLGLTEFEMQVAGISKETRKSNPSWFGGFFVKPATKPKWEEAAHEADKVMTLTRDERLDAFLDAMPSKGRKMKAAGDLTEGEDYDADGTMGEGSSMRENGTVGSPSSALKKIKLEPKTESPPTEKKKRGRPRKIDVSLNQSDRFSPDPVVKGRPGPGRPRKRKLLADDEAVNGETDDDSDGKNVKKPKRRKQKKKVEPEEQEEVDPLELAFKLFSESHLERLKDEYPEMTDEQAEEYLQHQWDRKTFADKIEYVPMLYEPDKHTEEDEEEDSDVEEEGTTGDPDTANTDARDADGEDVDDVTKETTSDEQPATAVKKKINLFRGYKLERVCQRCEKPGNTIKCRGPCAGNFHLECARGADNAGGLIRLVQGDEDDKPKKRGRKKRVESAVASHSLISTHNILSLPKPKAATRPKKIYAEEATDSDLDYDDGEDIPEACDDDAVMRMILGDSSALPEVTVLDHKESSDEEYDSEEPSQEIQDPSPIDTSSIADFRCGDCAFLRTPLCFVCNQATDPTGEDSVRIRCSAAFCGKHYHIECLKVNWPQANYTSNKGVIQTLNCPQHVCHTCVSDNPRDHRGRSHHEKLVRCIRCPTTYHFGNHCVPAGCEILTASQMICASHYPKKKNHQHINASWCFICSMGGSLICCDLCPSSFHLDCLKIKPPTGSYICEDCETGRFPLYGEVLWVKLGAYRWWPAVSLFPSEVPDNVKNSTHRLGEFAVRFLGTKDHSWIDRGRCYFYHEGDGNMTKVTSKNQGKEKSYQNGLVEAKKLHREHKEMRALVLAQSKPASMKPPSYTKIRSNKPVGSIKALEVDTSNISPCECDPDSDHPCNQDSECLNRILLVECDPNICPAGAKCENQCFEKRVYPSLAPCYTDGRGWGLQVLEDIKKGSFVIEYVGEVIDDEEYERRLKVKHEDKDENYYFLTIDSTRIIDAGPKGNVSRFMNHSCKPNCETQKWTVAGDTRVGLFALEDISAGTELTFNYNLESKGNEKKPCMCGTSVCSGFIGAKKNKILQPDMKEPLSGKKRRKPRVRNLIEDVCLLCDGDKEAGALMLCRNKLCASKYHLSCLGLTSTPRGKWYCPRHRCNSCQEKTLNWCSYCTESYCSAHVDGNLFSDPLHGDICETHQKNPLSKDHFKKKREEVQKRREEEKNRIEEDKRKLYEEERARRRSRREQINDEDTPKVKQSNSDLDDNGVEVSSGGKDNMNELTPTDMEKPRSEGDVPNIKRGPKSSPKFTMKTLPSGVVNQQTNDSKSPKTPGKRGRKRKVIPSESPKSPHPHSTGVQSTGLNGEIQEDVKNFSESKRVSPSDANEESQVTSSYLDDSGKDEIPDADPTLDKFIMQVPAPIDDDPSPETKKRKLSSPQNYKVLPKEASPSSITKRRRKPPMHNKDFINIQNLNLKTFKDSTPDKLEKQTPGRKPGVKKPRESTFDNVGLNDQLEELAVGFASDDGEERCSFPIKKPSVRGKGKRLGMGVMRSPVNDSLTSSKISHSASKVDAVNSSPSQMMSPVSSVGSPLSDSSIIGSPEHLSASKIFAMQRAKGARVMPPNRRLSSAREQAFGRMGDGTLEKAERSAKGLKVLRGRPPSVDSSPNDKKTENLHGEVLLSGPTKKIRPVLSKVHDNGVSLDDESEDKVADNGSLPKQSQPHAMQSPPIKKAISTSQKQSSAIGLSSSLWNQDILNIIN